MRHKPPAHVCPSQVTYAATREKAHKYPMDTSHRLVKAIRGLDGQCPHTVLALDVLLLLGRTKRSVVYEGSPLTLSCTQNPHQRHSKPARKMSTSSTQSTGSTPLEGARGSLDEHFAYVENMTARRVAVGAVVAKANYVHVQRQKDGDAAKGQGVSKVIRLDLQCEITDSIIDVRLFQRNGRRRILANGLGHRWPGLLKPFNLLDSWGQPSAD